jgi:hypothetical protein
MTERTTDTAPSGANYPPGYDPALRSSLSSPERPCTCHPDEAPVPCQHRFAYSECLAAADPSEAVRNALAETIFEDHQDTRDFLMALERRGYVVVPVLEVSHA